MIRHRFDPRSQLEHPPEISNLRIDESGGGFVDLRRADPHRPMAILSWHAELQRKPARSAASRREAGAGLPDLPYRSVILHPLAGVAGRPMEIEHVDGTVERTEAPQLIDPAQPDSAR